MAEPLSSPEAYANFIYTLTAGYPSIRRSTLVYISSDTLFGRVEGMLIFARDTVLCVQEYLNFELGVIEGYGYEVSHSLRSTDDPDYSKTSDYCEAGYPHKEKLYWYDSMPHPDDPSLAATDPHHKHIPPDIKRHRIPAPNLSFTRPNLSFLIEEIEQTVLATQS